MRRFKNHGVRFVVMVMAIFGGMTAMAHAVVHRPDLVIIMLDDLGYSDLGCYGGEIRTPNINALAEKGLRFTRFYNASRCCPTRAALLTGLYPHQVGLQFNGRSLTHHGVTMAEALGAAGYHTGMVGKWHLSETPVLKDKTKHQAWLDHRHDPGMPFADLKSYPVNRGFEKHYGIVWGVVNYFDPFSLVDGLEPVRDVSEGYYITNAINAKSVEYVQAFAKEDKPFFLYVAHTAPHWPLHALPEDIAKYKGMYEEGWHALRQRRYARQVEMGLVDPVMSPLPPLHGHGSDWFDLSEEQRRYQASKMRAHAAMVDRVDQGVGQLVAALKVAGRYENTVILVLADNGASPEVPGGPGYDRTATTRDGTPVIYRGTQAPGAETTYTGIGSWWANAANTPFRYWKKESYEGGCHTPLIVHWPAGLKTTPGSFTHQIGHVIDIMPTALELAGAAYPEKYGDHVIAPVEGKSLAPIFREEMRTSHEALCFEHEGGRSIIAGGWKLVAAKNKPWELYHLEVDRTELKDLADQHPERAEAMSQMWNA